MYISSHVHNLKSNSEQTIGDAQYWTTPTSSSYCFDSWYHLEPTCCCYSTKNDTYRAMRSSQKTIKTSLKTVDIWYMIKTQIGSVHRNYEHTTDLFVYKCSLLTKRCNWPDKSVENGKHVLMKLLVHAPKTQFHKCKRERKAFKV